MLFSDLCAESERMLEDLRYGYVPEYFNDIFAALGAGRYAGGLLGWDSYEQDYYGIDVPMDWAESKSKERLLKLKKEQLLESTQISLKI